MAAMVSTLKGEWIKLEYKGGKGPGPRSAHAMAVVGDKLYVFGGELKANKHIDKHLYFFDLYTHTWSIAPPNGNAPPVSVLGVRMVAVGTNLYVYGGRDEHSQFSDFYSYDTVKKEWKLLTTLGEVDEPPEARTFHSMTSDENHVYIFGGVSKQSGTMDTPVRFRTIDAYNIADGKWVKLPDPGYNFEKRGGAGFAAVQGKLWVVYGFASAIAPGPGVVDNYESDAVHYFDLDSGKWVEVKTTGAKPSPRSVFAHAVVGKYIIIYGGEIYPDPLGHLQPGKLSNQGYVLDTETLVWENLAESLKPTLPIGWSAYATATVRGKKGLLMHGGKLLTNERTDDLYFYAVKSA